MFAFHPVLYCVVETDHFIHYKGSNYMHLSYTLVFVFCSKYPLEKGLFSTKKVIFIATIRSKFKSIVCEILKGDTTSYRTTY